MTRRLLPLLLAMAVLPAQVWGQIAGDGRSRFMTQVDGLVAQAAGEEGDSASMRGLAKMFGAERLADRMLYRQENGRYFAGLDGAGGQWFATAALAQGFLLRSLVAESAAAPAEVKSSVASLPNTATLAAVASAAAQSIADTRLMLARGGIVSVSITPKASLPAGQPILAGPPGIRVDRLERSGDTLSASIAAGSPLTSGPLTLRLFAAGHAFTALQSIAAYVVAGEGEPALPSRQGSDQEANAPILQVGEVVSDPLPPMGGRNHYRLLLAQPGAYVFSTGGSSDTVLSVWDGQGNRLGRDDDSGQRYNARLGLTLVPGVYTIAVEHCCAGNGSYRLEINPGP